MPRFRSLSLTFASSYNAERSPASLACWKYWCAAARLPLALSCWPNLIRATVDVMRLSVSPLRPFGASVGPSASASASALVLAFGFSADGSDDDDVDGASDAVCADCADCADAVGRTSGGGAGGLRPWASSSAL